MNWFTVGGVFLHLLSHFPQYVDSIEQLFDTLRGEERAPTEVWQAVSNKIEEAKTAA